MFKILRVYFFAMLIVTSFSSTAQITTSSITGIVADSQHKEVIGAIINAVHQPSGTQYRTSTNIDGRYTIQGMRTGGPYQITIAYTGSQNVVFDNIQLKLGDEMQLDAEMQESPHLLDEVVVKGTKFQQIGTSKNFSSATITNTPTVKRNIYDIINNSPATSVSKIGGISFTGTNNRYNSFTIDGSMYNDVFGLSASGTNGGKTRSNPISIDAIQEIQVVIAPFDVRQSGFTGGGINAITKQGNNDFHGSFYTYYNNQNLYGKYDAQNDYSKSNLVKQNTTTIGGNISGAIIKNKLFFFTNIENSIESQPANYYAGYQNYISTETAQQIADRYAAVTGQQEGYGPRNIDRHEFNLMARIDWNINENNKLALRYMHNNSYDEQCKSYNSTYYFNNSCFKMNNNTNSFLAELNSRLNSSWNNEARISYSRVRDNADVPYLAPLICIQNIKASDYSDTKKHTIGTYIGTEYSSGANSLDQDIYTLEDNVAWYKGKHTFTFGTHNELFFMRNLFIQANTGEWIYDNLEDFLNDNPNKFVLNCSDPEMTGGDLHYAPTIKAGQFGFYAQDKYEASTNLQITYGIRIDLPVFLNSPNTNDTFNAYAERKGINARTGTVPATKVMLSPRFGFRWHTDDSHKSLIRGGIGLFTGKVPFVWMANAYLNNGVEQTGTTINGVGKAPTLINPATNKLRDLTSILNSGSGTTVSPNIVTTDKNFSFPQVLRTNLAWDMTLPCDIKMTLEGLFSKSLNNIYFKNLSLTQTGSTYAVPGVKASAVPFYSVDKSYYSIISTENTNKGYSYSLCISLDKTFDFGLSANASYTFGHSKSIFDGTGSVAYSNWKYNYTTDSNNPTLGYSLFDQPHRIVVTLGYTTPKYATGWLQTSVNVIYNGFSGMRYSLSMNETKDFNGDSQRGNTLLYIPTDEELSMMNFTDEQSRADFAEFIANDKYAKHHRGQYAERNSNCAPWENVINLHFAQDFFVLKNRGSKFQFTFDILNFGNLLNKKWGASYETIYNVTPLTVTQINKMDNGLYNAVFSSNSNTSITKSNLESRWHAQLGFRLIF